MFVFGLTWEPLSWIYPPEVNVLGLRYVGAAAAVGSEWIFAFVQVMVGPATIAAKSYLIYVIFGIITTLGVPFVYSCILETRGKHLEESELIFEKGPVRKSGVRNKAEYKRRKAFVGGDSEQAEIEVEKQIERQLQREIQHEKGVEGSEDSGNDHDIENKCSAVAELWET